MTRFFRRIHFPFAAAGAKAVMRLLIPFDKNANGNLDAAHRHFRRLAKMDPVDISEMMSSKEGSELLGRVEIIGGADGMDLLDDWDKVVSVDDEPGPLSREHLDRCLRDANPEG